MVAHVAVLPAMATLAPAVSLAAGGPGDVQVHSCPGGYRAIVYGPTTLDRSRPAPLGGDAARTSRDHALQRRPGPWTGDSFDGATIDLVIVRPSTSVR